MNSTFHTSQQLRIRARGQMAIHPQYLPPSFSLPQFQYVKDRSASLFISWAMWERDICLPFLHTSPNLYKWFSRIFSWLQIRRSIFFLPILYFFEIFQLWAHVTLFSGFWRMPCPWPVLCEDTCLPFQWLFRFALSTCSSEIPPSGPFMWAGLLSVTHFQSGQVLWKTHLRFLSQSH